MPVDGWSLAASVARFGWAGGVERRDGEAHYRLAFADDDGAPFAVRLAQDELGLRVHSDDALSRAATFQLARLLSIAWPADDEGFPAVGARDPVVAQLQARFPGARPIGAASVLEAAVRWVLGLMLPPRIADAVGRRLGDELGDRATLDGAPVAGFPGPERLADQAALAAVRGLTGERDGIRWKRERIAALARLDSDGDLDGAQLRAWDGPRAVEHLAELTGLGEAAAQQIAARGARHPDVLLSHAAPVQAFAERAYGLAAGDRAALESAARGWAPSRSRVSGLALGAAERA